MPVITLPDGSQREFEQPVSVADIALDIGPGLAKAALAGCVDGRLVDTVHVVDADAEVAIVTEQGKRIKCLEVAIQLKTRRRQLGLVPHRRHGKADMRVAGRPGSSSLSSGIVRGGR